MPSSFYFNLATWHTINFAYTRGVWADLQQLSLDTQSLDAMRRLLRLIEERAGHWLACEIEAAKIALSQEESTALILDRLEDGLAHTITRPEFDTAATPLVDRIRDTVNQLLAQAGIAAEQIDTLFFTGGASGIPLLRDTLSAALPASRRVEGDLFGSIGAGLAVDAWRRYGAA
jgi:hypothetical chaperone protein